jgi:hypothetical protein
VGSESKSNPLPPTPPSLAFPDLSSSSSLLLVANKFELTKYKYKYIFDEK